MDLSMEQMVAAELRGSLIRIELTEKADTLKAARELLESGRPFTRFHSTPGAEIYRIHDGDDEEGFYTKPDAIAYEAFVIVYNTDPPRATCQLMRGMRKWVRERFDLGPFVFPVEDKVVAVFVKEEAGEPEDEEDG